MSVHVLLNVGMCLIKGWRITGGKTDKRGRHFPCVARESKSRRCKKRGRERVRERERLLEEWGLGRTNRDLGINSSCTASITDFFALLDQSLLKKGQWGIMFS